MNNMLSYCLLVDAKIRASDKDLPVHMLEMEVLKFFMPVIQNELKFELKIYCQGFKRPPWGAIRLK